MHESMRDLRVKFRSGREVRGTCESEGDGGEFDGCGRSFFVGARGSVSDVESCFSIRVGDDVGSVLGGGERIGHSRCEERVGVDWVYRWRGASMGEWEVWAREGGGGTYGLFGRGGRT